MSVCLSVCLSLSLSIYLSVYLSVYLSICLSVYLSIYLSLSFSISLSVCLSAYLSVYLQAWKRSYSARLPQFWTWQHQKRSNSARLPQFLNLTTSKTKQFCETSSFLEFDTIKNEAILRDFLQKWKVECSADGLVPMRFAIFPLHLSKVLRLPRKIDARSYEVLHLSRKIILGNRHIWCSKMQPLSGNQRPDLLTSLMNMSLVLRLPGEMHLCRSSSNVPRLPSFSEMLQNPHVLLTLTRCTIPCTCHAKRDLNVQKWSEPLVFLTFWLGNVLCATASCTFSTSQLPKVVRSWCVSRHNGVHFCDISASKSGPNVVCFVHFDLEMCFAPQRRALFRHRNFQKWSAPGVLCAFWLGNVLRATTACAFSTSQLSKVLRATTACNFSSLLWPAGSAPAALASLLFDPPELQIIGKTQWIATFLPFRASPSSFFLLFLSYSSLFWSFSSLCLCPALLFICPYCRKFDF